jgi:curved DNA-binding protein CbpA
VVSRDPYEVLGVERGASQAAIKAAWRRLARQHHPDVVGPDTAATRAATRLMAQINAAYEALRDGGARAAGIGGSAARSRAAGSADGADLGQARRRGGPPRPRPGRPLTGRLDTTDTFRGRNRTTTPPGARAARPAGPAPARPPRAEREAPRASDPTGPLRRGRLRAYRPPSPPELAAAQAIELDFGKFRGHTLGEVAAFEPSYIDWIASTITRDAGLVAAARVLRDDLDRRGVVRRRRETERQRRETERQRREWTRIFGEAVE